MKQQRVNLLLDQYDQSIIINALNGLRTKQIQENRPTDPVDDLIIRVSEATRKKVKVIDCDCRDEER